MLSAIAVRVPDCDAIFRASSPAASFHEFAPVAAATATKSTEKIERAAGKTQRGDAKIGIGNIVRRQDYSMPLSGHPRTR